MLFKDVVGQSDIKSLLKSEVQSGHMPHALLLAGETGYGTMALALALANYVLCPNITSEDCCGTCPECVKVNKLIHPDLHFSFPFIKKGNETTTEDYIKDWRNFLLTDKYFDLNDWLKDIHSENKQATIMQAEARNIIRKLSLASYEGGWKIMIIWLPEKMKIEAANTLLKTLEEPSKKTLFILCSEHPEQILTTILSRTHRINVPPLRMEDITEALVTQRGIERTMAINIARTSKGNYLTALRHLCSDDNSKELLGNFITLMRLAYLRDLKGIANWSEQNAALSREQQKQQLAYMQNMIRECFMYNFGKSELNFMTSQERDFATKFAKFINERNVIRFTNTFADTQQKISGNANSKMEFYNLALQTTILLRA